MCKVAVNIFEEILVAAPQSNVRLSPNKELAIFCLDYIQYSALTTHTHLKSRACMCFKSTE